MGAKNYGETLATGPQNSEKTGTGTTTSFVQTPILYNQLMEQSQKAHPLKWSTWKLPSDDYASEFRLFFERKDLIALPAIPPRQRSIG